MNKEEFTTHACEQALRFTSVGSWEDLSGELKIQLTFNVGAMSLGLNLSKEDGYKFFTSVSSGEKTLSQFHEHVKKLVEGHEIEVRKENIERPF